MAQRWRSRSVRSRNDIGGSCSAHHFSAAAHLARLRTLSFKDFTPSSCSSTDPEDRKAGMTAGAPLDVHQAPFGFLVACRAFDTHRLLPARVIRLVRQHLEIGRARGRPCPAFDLFKVKQLRLSDLPDAGWRVLLAEEVVAFPSGCQSLRCDARVISGCLVFVPRLLHFPTDFASLRRSETSVVFAVPLKRESDVTNDASTTGNGTTRSSNQT